MAVCVGTIDVVIGDFLYPIGCPVRVGRVVQIEEDQNPKWLGAGNVYLENQKGTKRFHVTQVRSFAALLADHEKKIKTLKGYLKKNLGIS